MLSQRVERLRERDSARPPLGTLRGQSDPGVCADRKNHFVLARTLRG